MLQKITLLFFLLASLSGYAYHLRTAEISYAPVKGQARTYDITVTLYLNNGVNSDQAWVYISLGDNSPLIKVYRSNGMGVNLPWLKINKSTYTHRYTFRNDGTYIIATAIDNRYYSRNYGILNIPNSDTWQMYVSSMLTINNTYPPITSPFLSFPPIGDGCNNTIYKINPGAIDLDQDILRFQLMKCNTANNLNNPVGTDIPGYKYPNELDPTGRTSFTMDSLTGEITWDKPTFIGVYNIAFKVKKFRNGVLIGYVIRDMQVTIDACANTPPVIDAVPDFCLQAGTPVTYKITSNDQDNDTLTITTSGIPFDIALSPAKYTPEGTNIGTTAGTFNWNTNTLHFSKNPYQVYYKVTDRHVGSSLTDVTSNFITLIAPSVKNVSASANKSGFNVKWDQTVCTQATGYNIYRKIGPSNIVFNTCMLGVPINSGFSLAGSVNNLTTLSFLDSNNGIGFSAGYSYCYIVTAKFADGAESSPSEPFCSQLMLPLISVIQDTLTNCLGTILTMDSTIIKFDHTNQHTIYSWSSSPGLQLTNANSSDVHVKLISEGLQVLKVEVISGTHIDSAKIYFQVIPNPLPIITLTDLGGNPNSVIFYNKSKNASRAEWIFPDGTRSFSMDSVLYQFVNNGKYRIYLKVFNSLDCPDTTSIVYRAVKKGIAMPNAFEPENPSTELNNFRPVALGLQTYFMGIWDLWGNLIWSTDKVVYTQPGEGWKGTDSKGRKMPSQNYIWRMKVTFIDGTIWKGIKDHFGKYHTEGTFILLR